MQLHPLVAIFDPACPSPGKAEGTVLAVPSRSSRGGSCDARISKVTTCKDQDQLSNSAEECELDSIGSYMRSEFSAARLINLHSLCVTAPLLGARVADDKTSAGQIIRYTVVSVGIPGRKTLTRLAKECQRVRLTAILVLPGTEANPPVRG
ncbi:hypothetical protein CIHG_04872 [Coccidioides immitis H538.4]|uniref:Uncharacterized protein n=1 Tax=Coccidioides immitis H538.4 TaxID=396776 RepID=A0A0J8UHM3_COCIT|nr:hypothetical protein CIHG_04872 [Coccidioides immitis H538.4]